jgi:phage shock protein A
MGTKETEANLSKFLDYIEAQQKEVLNPKHSPKGSLVRIAIREILNGGSLYQAVCADIGVKPVRAKQWLATGEASNPNWKNFAKYARGKNREDLASRIAQCEAMERRFTGAGFAISIQNSLDAMSHLKHKPV